MNITELQSSINLIIKDIKDHGKYPKECEIDYKKELKIDSNKSNEENFLINFFKDILAFTNGNGGTILLGFQEDMVNSSINDIGLDDKNIQILSSLDISEIAKKISKYTKVEPCIDIQTFNISSRVFYYILIEKSNQVLISSVDIVDYKIKLGQVWYRNSGKNCEANESTSKINNFIQIKANETSKEFMTIWSNLLPEMIDINPKEVLILNVADQKVYGFNKKGGKLDGGRIEVDDKSDTFKIILESIQEGEIGKISNTEGKPIFRIVGDKVDGGDPLTTASKKVKTATKYNFNNQEFKDCLVYLGYTTTKKINTSINIKPDPEITELGRDYIFRICTNQSEERHDLRVSSACTSKIIDLVSNEFNHHAIFGKTLSITRINKIKKP